MSINLRKDLFPNELSMDDMIYVGALFHDVTKGIEPHHETGAHLVKSLLQDECSPEKLEIISDIIAHHNTRNRDELPFYIKIVQDADILDHFGSMDIWLKIIYSAHAEENVFDAIRLWDSEEHRKYLDSSRSALNYEKSKDIFDRKIQFENQFQDRFKLECNGEIRFESNSWKASPSDNNVFQLRGSRRSICLRCLKDADAGRHIDSPKIRAI